MLSTAVQRIEDAEQMSMPFFSRLLHKVAGRRCPRSSCIADRIAAERSSIWNGMFGTRIAQHRPAAARGLPSGSACATSNVAPPQHSSDSSCGRQAARRCGAISAACRRVRMRVANSALMRVAHRGVGQQHARLGLASSAAKPLGTTRLQHSSRSAFRAPAAPADPVSASAAWPECLRGQHLRPASFPDCRCIVDIGQMKRSTLVARSRRAVQTASSSGVVLDEARRACHLPLE